jgi:hypothetical protein
MKDKQNPTGEENHQAPAEDELPHDQNGSVPKSYYYDDATGYEIYREGVDDECDDSE